MTCVRWAPLAVLALLAGCGAWTPPSVQRSGGVVAMVNPSGASGMDALVSGVVTVSETGCLSLSGDGDSTPVPVAWPLGSRWDGESLTLPSGESLTVGQEMVGGGGETPPPSGWEPPAECEPVDGKVLIVASAEPA